MKETKKPAPLSIVDDVMDIYSDEERVEQAEKHLLKLLSDPYYDEAYQWIRRDRQLPPVRSNLPEKKGVLARDLRTLTETPSKPAHRPRKDNVALAYLARYFKDHPKMNQTDFCLGLVLRHKKLIQNRWPNIRTPKKLAEKLRKAVSNYRRGR